MTNFLVNMSDCVKILSITDIGELADILKRVVTPRTAHLFNTANHEAEAVEVLRSFRAIRNMLINYFLEHRINELTVIDFLLKLIVGLFGALFGSPSSKSIELVVT